MRHNHDKHLSTLESSGRVFHAHHGVIGVDPIGHALWEGGARTIPGSKRFSRTEKLELLEEVLTHWFTWADVTQAREMAQVAVSFALHVEAGGKLPVIPTSSPTPQTTETPP